MYNLKLCIGIDIQHLHTSHIITSIIVHWWWINRFADEDAAFLTITNALIQGIRCIGGAKNQESSNWNNLDGRGCCCLLGLSCALVVIYVLEGGQGGQSRKNGTLLPWMSEDEFFNMALTKARSKGVVTVTHLHWPLSIFIVVGRTERVLGCSPRILYFSPLAIFEEVDILIKDLGEAVLIQ